MFIVFGLIVVENSKISLDKYKIDTYSQTEHLFTFPHDSFKYSFPVSISFFYTASLTCFSGGAIMKRIFVLLIGFAALFTTINTASATIINIPSIQPSIQAGIDSASPGDTVLVQPGRYVENIDFKGKDIVVGSMFLATQDTSYISNTIIDGHKYGTVVTFNNGETEKAELCGMTVTGGYTLYDPNQLPLLIVLSLGSGIDCENASPYLHHLIIDGNFTYSDGGGIHLEKSNSVIEYCVIRNNRAPTGMGGGIYITNVNNKINNCIIENNSGAAGSGIFCSHSIIVFYKVLITKNISQVFEIHSSDVNIINCSIVNHDYDTLVSFYSIVNIINSILWNNRNREIFFDYEDFTKPISKVTIAFSDIKGGRNNILAVHDSVNYHNSNITADPFLNSDYTLSKNSPCIDAGTAYFQIGDSILVNMKSEEYLGKAPDMGFQESNYNETSVYNDPTRNISLSNFPNPFNSKTIINFSLNEPGHVYLSIYNITGQKVITLVNGDFPSGEYFSYWDGKDNSGKILSSGVYIIQLNSGNQILSKSMVLMK
jgi:hypothetical protein